jgi:hypothetical protein
MGITYIIHDTGCVVIISAWEGHALWKFDVTVSCYLYLNTVGVELGTSNWVNLERDVSFVEADHLSTNEVTDCYQLKLSRIGEENVLSCLQTRWYANIH